LQDEEDIVIEYVPAPAPDIEGLLQQAAPSSSKPEEQQQQAADDDEEDDGERGFGGLGLGATPGLGSGLGLGFKKAAEPAEAAVDTEVRNRQQILAGTSRGMDSLDGCSCASHAAAAIQAASLER
jgi:hypothetical protein